MRRKLERVSRVFALGELPRQPATRPGSARCQQDLDVPAASSARARVRESTSWPAACRVCRVVEGNAVLHCGPSAMPRSAFARPGVSSAWGHVRAGSTGCQRSCRLYPLPSRCKAGAVSPHGGGKSIGRTAYFTAMAGLSVQIWRNTASLAGLQPSRKPEILPLPLTSPSQAAQARGGRNSDRRQPRVGTAWSEWAGLETRVGVSKSPNAAAACNSPNCIFRRPVRGLPARHTLGPDKMPQPLRARCNL